MQKKTMAKHNFAAMKRFVKAFIGHFCRRHYLLMDGMHSCAYLPKHTYRKLMRMLEKSLERDPKAENSLRFVWGRSGGRYCVVVNHNDIPMTCTHGLVRDDKGRILIPCPYVQQIYAQYGIEPEWCGRMRVKFLKTDKALTELSIIYRP